MSTFYMYWIKQTGNSESAQKPIDVLKTTLLQIKMNSNRRKNVQFFNTRHTAHHVLHYPYIYQLPCNAQCYVLHSHISSCSCAFQCLLTPSAGCLNPNAGPSQHITYLCSFIVCLLNVVVLSFYVCLCIFRGQMKNFRLRKPQSLTDS